MTPRALLLVPLFAVACSKQDAAPTPGPAAGTPPAATRDLAPPPLEPNNIVSIAINSKDHTTLVAALKAADYVKSVANPGPLTVFAPTDAAFQKLPAGTVEGLVKPEKQTDLQNILKYHVVPAVYHTKDFKDGQMLGAANGKKLTMHVVDGKVKVNDANIVATVRASNGIVHVIDSVLLPPSQ